MITSSNTMALNNHCATALGPRLGLGLRLDFGSQVWFVQYFSENLVVVSPANVTTLFSNVTTLSHVLDIILFLLVSDCNPTRQAFAMRSTAWG